MWTTAAADDDDEDQEEASKALDTNVWTEVCFFPFYRPHYLLLLG